MDQRSRIREKFVSTEKGLRFKINFDVNVDVWDFSPMYAEIPIIGAPYHEAETLIDFVSRKKEISGSLPVNFQNEIL